eukprot:ANDGO_02148.mRNA.1 hypothetical protein
MSSSSPRYDTIAERSLAAQEEKDRKIRRLQEQLQQDVERELTFSPRINQNYRFKRTQRDSFLKSIQGAVDRQQKRIAELRRQREDEQQVTFSPQISTYSKSLPRPEPVHERLYKLSSTRSSPDVHRSVQEEEFAPPQSFTPRVNPSNLVREERVEDSLYQDAKNRRLRRQLLMANVQIEEENSRSQRKINTVSKDLARRKEQKELEDAFLLVTEGNVEAVLSLEEMGRVLFMLGYFREEYTRNDEEQSVLQMLWRDGMSISLFVELLMDPIVSRELRRFSVNRLVYNKKPVEKSRSESSLDTSRDQKRDTRRFELLLRKQADVEAKLQEERKQAENDLKKSCTFQPKILEKHLDARKVSFLDPDQISALNKEVQLKRQMFMSQKDDREKAELAECTFKPDIQQSQKYRVSLVQRPSTALPKGYTESIGRLRKAKQEREGKDATPFEHSLRIDSPGQQSPPKPTKPEPFDFELDKRKRTRPLLYMDVNLGPGKSGRIGIHEGDDPSILAKNFAESFKLDPVLTGRLEELLEAHMMNLIPGYVRQERSKPGDSASLGGYSSRHSVVGPEEGNSDVEGSAGDAQSESGQEQGPGSYAAQYSRQEPAGSEQDLGDDDDGIGYVDEYPDSPVEDYGAESDDGDE